jgi:hypothetical protein
LPVETLTVGFEPRLSVPLERLSAFDDRTSLRDPKARTSSPSLALGENASLEIRGPFQVRRTVQPTKERGKLFVEATGDHNPIHTDGSVVPGAWTASQMVAPLEVLFPRLRLTALRVSFTGIAWYERPVRITLKLTPTRGEREGAEPAPGSAVLRGLKVEAVAYQSDREIAKGEFEGTVLAQAPRVEVPERKVDVAWLARVEAFFRSLGIAPASYLEKAEGRDLSYPCAFLASLPSGEMVERLSGQGGILNRLTLEFDAEKLPIAGPPEVSLELPERLRKSFNKIVTRIKEGVLTAVRGSALILPRSEAPADVISSLEGRSPE